MSRIEPGRYTLLSRADRDAVLELLPEHAPAELASRLRYGVLVDVPSEESAAENAREVLRQIAELSLTADEQVELMTVALLIAGGALGTNPATDRLRTLFLAVHDRRRREAVAP
jgi:hypothetical protein